jgi:anaphase-promoting complex subunit 1
MRREQSLAIVVLACSVVMAGSCDVSLLRFIRFVRRRPMLGNLTQFVYGIHMILGMAVGVLNLGKGRFTLGSRKSDQALLLIAMFPRFSRSPSDNGFIIQPLRHLIASAAVPRVLEVMDVDSEEILGLYVSLGLTDGNEMIVKAPHVLPPLEWITSLRIDDPEYFRVELDEFPYKDEEVRPIIWVKKRGILRRKREKGIDVLRTVFNMSHNPIFQIKRTEDDDLLKTDLENQWDDIGAVIMEFIRCDKVKMRTEMMAKNQGISEFLRFYGLLPSVGIDDVSCFGEEALSFLVPHMNQSEVDRVLSSVN